MCRSVAVQTTRPPDAGGGPGPDFSPTRRLGSGRRGSGGAGSGGERPHQQAAGVGEQHQLPMPHNRPFGPQLVVGPAQLVLGRLVKVLDPVAQAVEGRDLRGARLPQRQ